MSQLRDLRAYIKYGYKIAFKNSDKDLYYQTKPIAINYNLRSQ